MNFGQVERIFHRSPMCIKSKKIVVILLEHILRKGSDHFSPEKEKKNPKNLMLKMQRNEWGEKSPLFMVLQDFFNKQHS